MRATPCCFSRFSRRMLRVSELMGRLVDRSSVRSSLPCSAHSPFIWLSFRSYLFLPFSSSPRQSFIIVISCFDFTICYETICFTFRFPVLLRYNNRDLPWRSMNYSACLVPTTFADCTLRFKGLLIPDFLRSSSSSIMPLMGRCSSGFVLRGALGQTARYFCTSSCFCSSWRVVRWDATLARTAWIRSVAGARFSSMRERSSPSWSSRSMKSPSSAWLEYICLQDLSSRSVFLAEVGREGLRECGVAACGLLTMALMMFWMLRFLSCATLLGGDSGQLQLWISLMLSRLQISGMITSFWKWGTATSTDFASSLCISINLKQPQRPIQYTPHITLTLCKCAQPSAIWNHLANPVYLNKRLPQQRLEIQYYRLAESAILMHTQAQQSQHTGW